MLDPQAPDPDDTTPSIIEWRGAEDVMATLSGASWVPKFPGSSSIADLEATFQANVRSFMKAMTDAGATISVSATYRPPERAYLMHWSWKIVKANADAQHIPAMNGVDIEWWHGDAASSKVGAQQMVDGYQTGGASVAPSLTSRHTEKKAIDMSISWSGTLSIKQADGTIKAIASTPRDGTNADLIAVGATYKVVHYTDVNSDRPHWSTDGH